MAAVLFALAIGILGGALYYFGTPSWAVNVGLIPDNAEPDLLLDMPRKPERRQLPSGDEYFAFSGRIVNASDQTQTVPPIIVEMRDDQDRLVFRSEEHTSELQSLMRISYAVFCLKT